MWELLTLPFMQTALAACLITVVICAVCGTLAVVGRSVYIAGGVAHAAYGGIGLALFAGFAPLLGALGAAVLMGAALGAMRASKNPHTDALVSALWAMGMALGVILTDFSSGYAVDYLTYLFGNILLVTKLDLILGAIFAALGALLMARYYHKVTAVLADQDYAITLGYNVRVVNIITLTLLCVGVVMLMRVAGLIMVMALLSIPASIAESHTRGLLRMILLTGVISFIAIFAGLFTAVRLNLTPSAAIVALLSIAYIWDLGWRKLRRR